MRHLFAFIIILLISLPSKINANEDKSVRLSAPIGQLFRLNIGEDLELEAYRLPKWLEEFEGGILEGIPQLKDLGTYLIYSTEGNY